MENEIQKILGDGFQLYAANYPISPQRSLKDLNDSMKIPTQKGQQHIVESIDTKDLLIHTLSIPTLLKGYERLIFATNESLQPVDGLQEGYYFLPENISVMPLYVYFLENDESVSMLVAPHKKALAIDKVLESALANGLAPVRKLKHELGL